MTIRRGTIRRQNLKGIRTTDQDVILNLETGGDTISKGGEGDLNPGEPPKMRDFNKIALYSQRKLMVPLLGRVRPKAKVKTLSVFTVGRIPTDYSNVNS